MNSETLEAIRKISRERSPREACGFVVGDSVLEEENVSSDPENRFAMRADAQARARQRGEIQLVWHSHPGRIAKPSESDRESCRVSGLAWVIVGGPDFEQTEFLDPELIPELPLIGRTFVHGSVDCYSLIRDYYKQELGLILPDFYRWDGWWNEPGVDIYRKGLDAAGFDETAFFAEHLQKHDVLLMSINSETKVCNHGGIYLGGGEMLHHFYGRLSARQPFSQSWQNRCYILARHRKLQ